MEEPYRLSTLPNGLRIVTEKIPYVRSVAIGFWFLAGSRYEDPAQNGISHFIEHMMFKGTDKRTAREIAETMDALGGQLNAYTSKEYTCYYARVLDQHFAEAVEILADMLLHSRLAEEEVAKEKGVVIEEIKMYEDTPDELIHDLFTAAILEGHPLGQAVLGKEETVRGLTREDLLSYLHRFYTPDALVVAVAGNIEHETVLHEVNKYFGELKGRRTTFPSQEPKFHPQVVYRDKKTEQTHLCVGTPGLCRNDEAKYALFLIDTIVGGGASSRLFQKLREDRGLVYSTYSYHSCFQDTGLFTVYAGTSPGQGEEVLELIKEELLNLARGGVTEAEMKRAKEQLKGNIMLSLESTTNRMSRLAKAILFYDEILTPDQVMAKVDAVTIDQVQALAQKMFQPDNFTIAAIGPGAHDLVSVEVEEGERVAYGHRDESKLEKDRDSSRK